MNILQKNVCRRYRKIYLTLNSCSGTNTDTYKPPWNSMFLQSRLNIFPTSTLALLRLYCTSEQSCVYLVLPLTYISSCSWPLYSIIYCWARQALDKEHMSELCKTVTFASLSFTKEKKKRLYPFFRFWQMAFLLTSNLPSQTKKSWGPVNVTPLFGR